MSKIDNQRDSPARENAGKDKPEDSSALGASEGKLFPPSSEVEVPRMPAKAETGADSSQPDNPPANHPVDRSIGQSSRQAVDEPANLPVEHAADHAAPEGPPIAAPGDKSRPVKIDTTESNWADSTQPAPDKRTARSSIL